MVKGYEFEKGRFVTFTAAELKALAEASRPTIDIVSFIPAGSVDPIYYDKAYYLAPDKPGSKPYSLLHAAMQASGRVALAKWAWRAKEYVVQIRPAGAASCCSSCSTPTRCARSTTSASSSLPVGNTELALALRLIEQIADDGYDPHRFVDEEKQRILAAVERKIAGRKVVAQPAAPRAERAGDRPRRGAAGEPGSDRCAGPARFAESAAAEASERKPARRAGKAPAASRRRAPAPRRRPLRLRPPRPARRRQSGR